MNHKGQQQNCRTILLFMTKVFKQKWDQIYRITKKKLGVKVTDQTVFGEIEGFDKKRIGIYHAIKNISYAQKKGSTWVNKTREQKNIQMPFSKDKFHFALMPYYEVVSFVDLNNCRLIYPQDNEDEQQIQPHCFETQHILKISKSHIAHGHSIFIPYLREYLPQVLNPRLIQSIIKLSGILPGQKIGFNSQGAGSTVNHFHAQLLDGNSLLHNNQFHFQSIKGNTITTLMAHVHGHASKVKLRVSSFEYVSALYIKVECEEKKIHDPSIISSVVEAVWTIVEVALANCIPHNLNVPNEHSVYIILRGFSQNDLRYGWVQFSGVQILTSENDFNNANQKEIAQRYARLALPRHFIEGALGK